MLEAMTSPGLNALQLFSALRDRLNGSDLAVTATRSLSPLFVFHPADYFSRLNHDCNTIDPAADTEKVRRTNINPLVEACSQALLEWPFAAHFERQRAAGIEQQVFRRSLENCDDVPAIVEYIALYPTGRFRGALEEFVAQCDTRSGRSSLPRTRVAGRGWELVYDATILRRISLDEETRQPDGAVRTIWQSVQHGTDAVMTLVIGANSRCLTTRQYLENHVVALRHDVRWPEEIAPRDGAPGGVLIHGAGSRTASGEDQARTQFIDAVFVTRSEHGTYLHLSVQFTVELAWPIIDEFQRIAESVRMTSSGNRHTACPNP